MRSLYWIVFVTVVLAGCWWDPALFPVVTPEPVDPIEAVACDTVVTEPVFAVLKTILDNGFAVDEKYTVSGNTYPDLVSAITSTGIWFDSVEVYRKDGVEAAVIFGLLDALPLTGQVFTYDAIGIKHGYTPHNQYLVVGDAVTYEQFQSLAQRLPSVNGFNFRGIALDSLQTDTLAKTILGECKAGRYWADFRHNTAPVSDSLFCAFVERGWELVLGPNLCQN